MSLDPLGVSGESRRYSFARRSSTRIPASMNRGSAFTSPVTCGEHTDQICSSRCTSRARTMGALVATSSSPMPYSVASCSRYSGMGQGSGHLFQCTEPRLTNTGIEEEPWEQGHPGIRKGAMHPLDLGFFRFACCLPLCPVWVFWHLGARSPGALDHEGMRGRVMIVDLDTKVNTNKRLLRSWSIYQDQGS